MTHSQVTKKYSVGVARGGFLKPAFSNALLTSESVVVRAPTSPSKLSMRRTVLMATPDFFTASPESWAKAA
jgi:hypothetical protein